MNQLVFTNNASATLAAPITNASTSLSVTSGSGQLFPAIGTNQSFIFTLQHINAGVVTAYEICVCTARSGDTFTTIVRAQEGTTALSWSAGDTVALLPTAAALNSFVQNAQLQLQSTNYALDVGTANSYVVTLTPPLVSRLPGTVIRFTATHTNTGNCTINDGLGTSSLLSNTNNNLPPGTIVGAGVYECIYSSSGFYQLVGSPYYAKTFTPIWTGFSNAPPGLIPYTVSGGIVSINFLTNTVAASNSSGLQLSGLPSNIWPAFQRAVPVIGMINGGNAVPNASMAIISASGNISMFVDGAFGSWTVFASKGFSLGSSIIYSL